jgi:hypothetical protein
MVDPQPRLVELLVRHVLLPREFLPQIEINSNDFRMSGRAIGVPSLAHGSLTPRAA